MRFTLAEIQPGHIGGPGLGPFGDLGSSVVTNPFGALAQVISLIVGFLTIVAGLFFLFQLLIGGLTWISAGGDKNQLQAAQQKITYAFLGLIVVAAAYGLTALAGTLLGIDILLVNPPQLQLK